MNVSVRDVDQMIFRKFKARTVEAGLKTGTAMTQALKEWTEKKEKQKKAKKSFFDDFKSWSWGEKNRNASMEVDKVVYGGYK